MQGAVSYVSPRCVDSTCCGMPGLEADIVVHYHIELISHICAHGSDCLPQVVNNNMNCESVEML